MTWEEVKASIKDGHIQWRDFLDERQLKQVRFSIVYANDFKHGADGHNNMLIIDRLADLLDTITTNIEIEVEEE